MAANNVEPDGGYARRPTSVRLGQPPVPKPDPKTGCCSGLVPRELYAHNKYMYARQTLWELLTYSLFLITLCIGFCAPLDESEYYVPRAMQLLLFDIPENYNNHLYMRFSDITSRQDVLYYLESYLPHVLYWDIGVVEQFVITDDEIGMIYYANELLTAPRLRMVRVRPDTCSIVSSFASLINTCYGYYSPANEMVEPTGSKPHEIYQQASAINGSSTWGWVSTYGGGGYILNLYTLDRNATERAIKELYNPPWIDRTSRALFVDFTVYNPPLHVFCIVRILFEFPPTGGIISSYSVRPLKHHSLSAFWDVLVLAIEGLHCLLAVIFLIYEIRKMVALKRMYWTMFWSYVDLALIILPLAFVVYKVYRMLAVDAILGEISRFDNKFIDFYDMAFYTSICKIIGAVCILVSWVKLFRYLTINRAVYQLSRTIKRCASIVMKYVIMFAIVFCAFIQLGHLIFCTVSPDFVNWHMTIFTLLRVTVGDFNFSRLLTPSKFLGVVYFTLFFVFVVFVLLCVFVAIIYEVYYNVRADLCRKHDEFHLLDYLKLLFHLEGKFKLKPRKCTEFHLKMLERGYHNEDIHEAIKDMSHCGTNSDVISPEEQQNIADFLESKRIEDEENLEKTDEEDIIRQRIDTLRAALRNLQMRLEDVMREFRMSDIGRPLFGMPTDMTRLVDVLSEAEASKDSKQKEKVRKWVAKELKKL